MFQGVENQFALAVQLTQEVLTALKFLHSCLKDREGEIQRFIPGLDEDCVPCNRVDKAMCTSMAYRAENG